MVVDSSCTVGVEVTDDLAGFGMGDLSFGGPSCRLSGLRLRHDSRIG